MIGMINNLVRREVEELFEPTIGEQVPAVGVLHINHGRGVVDDVLQEFLMTTKRLLGTFAIRHVLERARHADELTGFAPDGLASRAEPSIFSGFGKEAILHIVGLATLDMGG